MDMDVYWYNHNALHYSGNDASKNGAVFVVAIHLFQYFLILNLFTYAYLAS